MVFLLLTWPPVRRIYPKSKEENISKRKAYQLPNAKKNMDKLRNSRGKHNGGGDCDKINKSYGKIGMEAGWVRNEELLEITQESHYAV